MDRMSRSIKRGHNPSAHVETKKPNMEQPRPAHTEARKPTMEKPRRLLNRASVQNTLAERAASRNIQIMDTKPTDAIDVSSTNFLPKLKEPTTGNAKMRGMNPFAPEKKPIKDGTSYLDRYQMKPGFALPDVQDKIGIAARHQLQVRPVPMDIVKLDVEVDNQSPQFGHKEIYDVVMTGISSPSELMYPASPCFMPRPPTRTNGPRPATRASGPSPMYMAGPPNMPLGEGGYVPVPPTSPRLDGANYMPRPPAMPRGEGHGMIRDPAAYMPYPPPPRTDAWAPKPADQALIEGALYIPAPPPNPKRSGSERNVQSRAGAPHRAGGKKKLPPLRNADAKKRPH